MEFLRGNGKRQVNLTAGTIQCPAPEGSGKRARRWLAAHFPALDPNQHRVAWYLAGLANRDGHAWPSRPTIAAGCGMSVRTVQRTLEALIALGAIIEAGMVAVGRKGAAVLRTRRYRLPFDGAPVAVIPATARRRLVRLESAKVTLSPPIESAKVALSTGPEMGRGEPVESANVALSPASKVPNWHSIPRNLEKPDAGGVGASHTPTPPAPADVPTPIPMAAREPLPELTPAQIQATVDRRQRALRLLSPVRSTAAHEAGQDGATAKPADTRPAYVSPKQARELAPGDPRRNRYFQKRGWFQ